MHEALHLCGGMTHDDDYCCLDRLIKIVNQVRAELGAPIRVLDPSHTEIEDPAKKKKFQEDIKAEIVWL